MKIFHPATPIANNQLFESFVLLVSRRSPFPDVFFCVILFRLPQVRIQTTPSPSFETRCQLEVLPRPAYQKPFHRAQPSTAPRDAHPEPYTPPSPSQSLFRTQDNGPSPNRPPPITHHPQPTNQPSSLCNPSSSSTLHPDATSRRISISPPFSTQHIPKNPHRQLSAQN